MILQWLKYIRYLKELQPLWSYVYICWNIIVSSVVLSISEVVLNMIIMTQLTEPLTGTTWKLEDFEAYPALLVTCILLLCHQYFHYLDIHQLYNMSSKFLSFSLWNFYYLSNNHGWLFLILFYANLKRQISWCYWRQRREKND